MKTKTKITPKSLRSLIVALTEADVASKAKPVRVEGDNPMDIHDADEIAGGVGILKSADHIPAVNMAAKAPDSDLAFSLESERVAARQRGRADRSAKRMKVARARQARKDEFDYFGDDPDQDLGTPKPKHMGAAWMVVFHLHEIVAETAKSKQRWAARLLGHHVEDVPQQALEKFAVMLARQDRWPLDELAYAAEQMALQSHGIPGDQKYDGDNAARKRHFAQRKWLMGAVNNRVMAAIADAYRFVENEPDSLDAVSAVLAHIGGPNGDAMLNNFKADAAPTFMGTRFQRPGGIDPNLLSMAIAGAITDRGLDDLTEFLLDPEHIRTDGAVKWSKYAKDIFLLTPGGYGQWLWEEVLAHTQGVAGGRKARGDMARKHVRALYSWLPGVIDAAVAAFDFHMIGFATRGMLVGTNCDGEPVRLKRSVTDPHIHAVMASDFEWYLPEEPENRLWFTPALKHATPEEAATVLHEHLALLRGEV